MPRNGTYAASRKKSANAVGFEERLPVSEDNYTSSDEFCKLAMKHGCLQLLRRALSTKTKANLNTLEGQTRNSIAIRSLVNHASQPAERGVVYETSTNDKHWGEPVRGVARFAPPSSEIEEDELKLFII